MWQQKFKKLNIMIEAHIDNDSGKVYLKFQCTYKSLRGIDKMQIVIQYFWCWT